MSSGASPAEDAACLYLSNWTIVMACLSWVRVRRSDGRPQFLLGRGLFLVGVIGAGFWLVLGMLGIAVVAGS